MLSGNCTEALSTQANVTISGSSAKLIKNGIAPLPFPPRAAKTILVHKARGEGHLPAAPAAAQAGGEGTCSILCNVRVNSLNELNRNDRIPTQNLSGQEGPLGEVEGK